MKKVVISILALAYLSGISTLVLGHFLLPSNPEEPQSTEYFMDEVNEYSWVKHAHRYQSEKELLYYNQITSLYLIDERIGPNLLHADWLKDHISEEEARALEILVVLSAEDAEIAVSVSQSTWFQRGISSDELMLMEKMAELSQENVHVVKNITSSTWFLISGTHKIDEVMTMVMDMPPDLALAVSFASWFRSDASLSWTKAVQELTTLYSQDKHLAVSLPFILLPEDFESLQKVNELYSTDRELPRLFFQHNTLSRESFLALSDLSRIAAVDSDVAHSLIDVVTQDKIQIISSLADIYTFDPEIGKIASETFGNNRNALRYLQKVVEMGVTEPELLKQGAFFISDNPEFVYEDRIESYRYHLLTEILSELPVEKAQEYTTLISVTCSVYGNRFYLWQNEAYNTRNGWAYDKVLSNIEKEAVIELVTFFIEKNEEKAFVVDLRVESREYLYGVVDIPFTHVVNVDDTIVEAIHAERGTGFVFATITNIHTLRQRFEQVHAQRQYINQVQYTYSNPLVELIVEEGEERDVLFVYLCQKNWESGPCVNQTLQTRMDSIVAGISTTSMHWTAPEAAHMYPAYIPTDSIAEKVQSTPEEYGTPFVYKKFVSPYDEAGFKDSLDRDIEIVEIYDPQEERKVSLFHRAQKKMVDGKVLVLLGVGAVIILIRYVKR